MLKKLLTISIICTVTSNAIAFDGYTIPCNSDGSGGTCYCDAGTCTKSGIWNDSIGTFVGCDNSTCTCIDGIADKTITFTCGCNNNSDCPGGECVNGTCVTCKPCTSASTGQWKAYSTGYEKRTNTDCYCDGRTYTYSQYRCAPGYWGSSSNGTSGCTQCTSEDNAAATSAAGSTARTACYIASGTTFSNTSGSGTFTGNSYYCD